MTPKTRADRLLYLYRIVRLAEAEIAALELDVITPTGTRQRTASCGTDSGYYRHLRVLSDPACEPCLVAHRVATREAARRRKAAA